VKPALLLAGLLVAISPFLGVVGCGSSDSAHAEVIPDTIKTRMVYYAMPG